MGMDPITIGLGLGAASSIYGAVQGNRSQHAAQNVANQNFGLQQQAYNDTKARNMQLQNLILPMIGGNGSGFNIGQDGMMQQMRGMPDGRPDTGYLDSMRALSNQDLNDQISAQRGAVGSLGQRFGTAQSRIEAGLRERSTVGLGATYAQAGLQAQQLQQNKILGLLGILSGQQQPQVPQQQYIPPQGAGIGGAIGDIGNMAMLYPFLKGLGGGGGGGNMTNAGFAGGVGVGSGGGIPGSLFGGMRF
jgi:hypothetical protein